MILSILHYIFSTEEEEGGDVAYHLERVGVTVHHHLLPPPLFHPPFMKRLRENRSVTPAGAAAVVFPGQWVFQRSVHT